MSQTMHRYDNNDEKKEKKILRRYARRVDEIALTITKRPHNIFI